MLTKGAPKPIRSKFNSFAAAQQAHKRDQWFDYDWAFDPSCKTRPYRPPGANTLSIREAVLLHLVGA